MTNGDRIRQMSNEELAIKFGAKMTCQMCICHLKNLNCADYKCREGIKAYLESEEE